MNSIRPIGVWSAAPTPLTADLRVDVQSVERMVEAALNDEMDGLFLAGTCGEGPWLPDRERKTLVNVAARVARGRMRIAAQVSDNSPLRVLDNIDAAAQAGADLAIVAPPAIMMNATPERITAHFKAVVMNSPLPVGIYDLGARNAYAIPRDHLKSILILPNVHLMKDSSGDQKRRDLALEARRENANLRLFNGDEFHGVDYLEVGYDGCIFGGAVASAPVLHRMIELVQSGRLAEARHLEQEMNALLHGIYGGPSLTCWLTGLKYYLVRKGLFTSVDSYLEYPLTAACRDFIDSHVADPAALGARRSTT